MKNTNLCLSFEQFLKVVIATNMFITQIILKYSKNTSKVVYITTLDSPIGKLTAAADDDHLYIVSSVNSKHYENNFQALASELSCKYVEDKNKVLWKFEDELSAYFEGKLKKFTLPTKTFGSEFQKAVWDKLSELPFGSTQTYGDLATSLGRPPSHSRAVGAACGANPLMVVVPCHRLVASGSKGGFSSGVDNKNILLEHEKKFA